jgi:hypothetical protein
MSPAARKFKSLCNENLDGLLKHIVSWSDLANLGDLSVLAALLGGEVKEKAALDLGWVLDAKSCVVAKMAAPKSAATQCACKSDGKTALFVAGGVWINPAEWAQKRAKDETLDTNRSRPDGASWSARK